MMKNLSEQQITEFLGSLASAAPTPGGGGAGGLAGAMAAALSSMVANLTIGKEKFAEHEAEVQGLLCKANKARAELLLLMEADAAVFNSFMACYKLPKTTDKEKQTRAEAIHAAAKQAAEIPFSIGMVSVEVMKLAQRLAEIGNPGLITDAACSSLLARAALRCSLYNVKINLNLTKDAGYNAEKLAALEKALQEAETLEIATLQLTEKALN